MLKNSMKKVIFVSIMFSFVSSFLFFTNAALMGDVNADNSISASDARFVLRASVGLEDFSAEIRKIADVNGDAMITAADARLILRASVGLEELSESHIHKYTIEKIFGNSTCAKNGSKQMICECGEYITEIIPRKQHTEVVDYAVDSTCTKTGLTEGMHCSVCNEILKAQTIVSKVSHIPGEWVVDKEVSCTENGQQHRDCISCGINLDSSETEKLNHTTFDGVCDRCGVAYSIFDEIHIFLPDGEELEFLWSYPIGYSYCDRSYSECYSHIRISTSGSKEDCIINSDGTVTIEFDVDYTRKKGPYVGCVVQICDESDNVVGVVSRCHVDSTGNSKGTFTTWFDATFAPGNYYIKLGNH